LTVSDKAALNPIINNNKTFSFTKRIDETNYYIKDCFSIKEYAFKEDPNTAYRPQMEDMSKGIDRFAGDDNKGLFMIFDGHGGYEVAAFARNRIPELFEKKLSGLNDYHNQNNVIENNSTS
jgi:serine/threonine protein phosphatase PrpC